MAILLNLVKSCTHCDILPLLSDCVPLDISLKQRFMKFIQKAFNHTCPLISSGVARGARSCDTFHAPPQTVGKCFLRNELMLLRCLNVEADMGSVPEFPRVSINGG